MAGLMWSRLRLDWKRSLATLVAVMFAVTSFVVLTGATVTQRVEVLQSADAAYRSSYDVLVRPSAALTDREEETGRVRPNFLSDTYGGITMEQVAQIEDVPGVEVVAPIAMVGIMWAPVRIPIDLGDEVAASGTQVFRIATTAVSRGGFTMPSQSAYLYVTDRALAPGEVGEMTYPVEQVDGAAAYPCLAPQPQGRDQMVADPFEPAARYWGYCISRQDPKAIFAGELRVSIPVLVAAIDPDAEAELVGLDHTVTSGRYLTAEDQLQFRASEDLGAPFPREDAPVAPALLAEMAAEVDYGLEIDVEELDADSVVPALLAAKNRADQADLIAAAPAARQVTTEWLPMADLQSHLVASTAPNPERGPDNSDEIWTLTIMRPSGVDFTSHTQDTGGLAAEASEPDLNAYFGHGWSSGYDPIPGSVADSAYRQIDVLESEKSTHFGVLAFEMVGTYDPTRTQVGSPLSQVPLETYRTGQVTVADEATATALGQERFLSNLNPADYLMTAPSVLIPLDALGIIDEKYLPRPGAGAVDAGAPISAVRVRVADVTGWDAASRERVRLAAQLIHDQTGLAVDVTIGSALAQQSVTLTQTDGRPDLHLVELWTQKGVTTLVVESVDRKSVLLFGLILLASGLTVATVANVAVAAQRTDLGVLASIGHTPARITGLVLAQQATLGFIAGLAGALLAWPIATLMRIDYAPLRAVAAIPVAIALMLLASIPAALWAARLAPIDLLRPPVRAGRRSAPVSNEAALGWAQLARRPLRLIRAALGVAIAVTALGLLLAIAWSFRGAIVGNLLGDAIALQVRTVDIIAGIVLALLAAIGVAMTLSFGALEDAPDWAVLTAIGWTPQRISRAILTQGAAIGIFGATLGAIAAIAFAVIFTEATLNDLAIPIALVALGAIALSTVASTIPAATIRRLPPARVLAGR
ncbi:FtsX-like permease family protein [Propioniciclava sinopodophylli]|uniref:FtsX-like permease family protein n=2 Tax=Propioniciclava sinopodophylli TaxID=1837344 RepID=A0A4Q9KEX5_9ACTN|nr:FtsX-like permease family protein [Propioniciclava sinopodophylli]